MAAKKLNKKQKTFVNEYLKDLNATQAAIRAGYSKKTAQEQSSRLLSNVIVSEAIRERMKDREKRTEITQDKVLEQLAKIAFSDMKDFMSWQSERSIVGYAPDGSAISDIVTRIHFKDSDEVDGTLVQEVSETNKGGSITHSMKLEGRMKALELLGKHLGMFTDKIDLTGDLSMRLEVDYGDDDE